MVVENPIISPAAAKLGPAGTIGPGCDGTEIAGNVCFGAAVPSGSGIYTGGSPCNPVCGQPNQAKLKIATNVHVLLAITNSVANSADVALAL